MTKRLGLLLGTIVLVGLGCLVLGAASKGSRSVDGPLAYYNSSGQIGPATGTDWNQPAGILSTTTSTNYDGLQVLGFGTFPGLSMKLARGTDAAPTPPYGGDPLMLVEGSGWNGSGYATGAGIIASTGENWTATANGAGLDIFATPNGRHGVGWTAIHIDPASGQLRVSLGENGNQFALDPAATVHIRNGASGAFGGNPPGPTKLVVQQGLSQGSTPLQEWQGANGNALARINADGSMQFFVGGVWKSVMLQ